MDRDEIALRVSDTLRAILRELEVKPAALADALGLSQSTMSRIVRGEQLPSIDQLLAIEVGLGVVPGTVGRRSGVAEPPEWALIEYLTLHPGLDAIAVEDLVIRFEAAVRATAERRAHDMRSVAEAMMARVLQQRFVP
jgi:transcriptional regulator with XRE-family HTH domain